MTTTILSSLILKEWSETPRTLVEELTMGVVERGEVEGRLVNWKGPTKEPFLTLHQLGGVKLEFVTRLVGGNVTVHFWQLPDGSRSHLKVKTT